MNSKEHSFLIRWTRISWRPNIEINTVFTHDCEVFVPGIRLSRELGTSWRIGDGLNYWFRILDWIRPLESELSVGYSKVPIAEVERRVFQGTD